MVVIWLFASLKDAAGTTRLQLELPEPCTVDDVYRLLEKRYPELSRYRPVVNAALNEEYVDWDRPVSAGDELAFFPPVSGGRR